MNETGKLRTVFLWALLPIVCFALAIPLTNWIAKENDLKTSADYKNIAWEKVIVSSPDVVFQDPDSIKCLWKELSNVCKKNSLEVADITNLFPECGAKKLLAIKKIGTANPFFLVWNFNGTQFDADIVRCNNGDFALATKEQFNGEGQLVPLGEFKGRLNDALENSIDKSSTMMDVVATVTLLLCLLGCGFVCLPQFDDEPYSWLCWVPFSAAIIAFFPVFLWLSESSNWYSGWFIPEWITVAWLISEVGLLSGVIYRLYVPNLEPREIKSIQEHSKLTEICHSIWEEDGGIDSLVINKDGTLFYTSKGRTSKYEYTFSDNESCILASDNKGNTFVLKLDEYGIIFNGKLFGYGGVPYETRRRMEVEVNAKCREKNHMKKVLGVPEKDYGWRDGSWKKVTKYALYAVGCIIALVLLTVDKLNQNYCGLRQGQFNALVIVLSGGFWLFSYRVCGQLKQILGRKRRAQKIAWAFDDIFDKVYWQLKQPELTDYLRAALKNPKLSVKEWKSHTISEKDDQD